MGTRKQRQVPSPADSGTLCPILPLSCPSPGGVVDGGSILTDYPLAKIVKADDNRNPDGTFKRGKSGNPAGRPKGSKNQITLLRQSLELQLREQAAPDMGAVLDKAVEMALDGHPGMIKLLIELHMAKQSSDEEKASERTEIKISTPQPVEVKQATIIDATAEDITDNERQNEESVQ